MPGLIQTQGGKQDPLSFTKMAGGGNDFVVVDNRSGRIGDGSDLARRVCTRALSVGGDGLILVENTVRATFRMRYFNSDGSLGEFCGNGTRCAARFALVNVIAARNMTIETDAGIVRAEVVENLVTITMPQPDGFRPDVLLRIDGTSVRGSFVRVGVPHYVTFLRDDLWTPDVVPLGRAIRRHRDLEPGGANANFVVVRNPHAIEVRTYERGVEGETLSCGSGVVASTSVAALFGKVTSPVSVLTRSGITLEVSFALDGRELRDVRLKGDARIIYKAALTPETLEGFDPDFVREPSSRKVLI
ncbi:MAG TPA: diaminopimelate epimerase [Thermoanaerobaculia bacterium]|nr:diaminopimelate epimerase [Thermoanaerobaculia bacterium]